MLRACDVAVTGRWSGDPADIVSLDYQARHRRRIVMRCDGGLRFVLDLPHARVLRDGDGLRLEDGRLIMVRAKPEPLIEITARDPHHLARLAWHLGNRHVPAAIQPDRVLIASDAVLRQMLIGLGASLRDVVAPFEPEPGAYADPDGSAHLVQHHSHV